MKLVTDKFKNSTVSDIITKIDNYDCSPSNAPFDTVRLNVENLPKMNFDNLKKVNQEQPIHLVSHSI